MLSIPGKLSFKGRVMKNSIAILTTVALGAVLAIGSTSASMARDAGSHGRGFGGEPSSNTADAGDHAYGETIPYMANNGSNHGLSFRHGFGTQRSGYHGALSWLNPYNGR